MSSGARRAVRFGLRFVPIFLLLLWVYPKILPSYGRLVVGAANRGLAALSPALRVEIGRTGDVVTRIVATDGGRGTFVAGAVYHAATLFSSLVLLGALILATPMRFPRMLGSLAIGLPALWAIHVLTVVLIPHSRLVLDARPHDLLWGWIAVGALTSGPVGSMVVWALVTWGFWFPERFTKRSDGPQKSKRGAGRTRSSH